MILLVLLALSISAVYVVFDSLMTLRSSELMPAGLADEVRAHLLKGQLQPAIQSCNEHPSVLAVVLQSGLEETEFGWREVEKATEDALFAQSARLLRRVEYMSVIGNIAPMVGLLGTVTGMIFAFQEVAGSEGAAGAADLAGGIYQALVTTVGGLVVAIPALGLYAVLRNRVDALIAAVAQQASAALQPIKRSAARKPGRPQKTRPPIPQAPPPSGE